jgi:hypothetical protein
LYGRNADTNTDTNPFTNTNPFSEDPDSLPYSYSTTEPNAHAYAYAFPYSVTDYTSLLQFWKVVLWKWCVQPNCSTM